MQTKHEEEFYLDMTAWAPNGEAYVHRRTQSGPFRDRAEAERAMREALGTGRFAAVALRAEKVEL